MQEAIASFQRGVELAPWYFGGPACLAAAYSLTGDRERCREWLAILPGWRRSAMGEAFYYSLTGEADAMFDALERAYLERHDMQLYMPQFDLYRADPRFQDLLRRIHVA